MEYFEENKYECSFFIETRDSSGEEQRFEFKFYAGKKIPHGGGVFILCKARFNGNYYEPIDKFAHEPDYIPNYSYYFADAQYMPDKIDIYEKNNADSVLIYKCDDEKKGENIVRWLKKTYYYSVILGGEYRLIKDPNTIFKVIKIIGRYVDLRGVENKNDIRRNIRMDELDF